MQIPSHKFIIWSEYIFCNILFSKSMTIFFAIKENGPTCKNFYEIHFMHEGNQSTCNLNKLSGHLFYALNEAQADLPENVGVLAPLEDSG